MIFPICPLTGTENTLLSHESSKLLPKITGHHFDPLCHTTSGVSVGHTCNVCGKWYRLKDSLGKHLLTHRPRFGCAICPNKQFSRASILKSHLNTQHRMSMCFHCYTIFPIDETSTHICQRS